MTVRALALTSGEPAGIGPDLCVMAAQRNWSVPLVAIGDPALLQARARQLDLPLELQPWTPPDHTKATPQQPAPAVAGALWYHPVALKEACHRGQLATANAPYVLETLRHAVEGCQSGQYAGLVTAPVHKGVINDAGIPFSGHTEFLAEQTGGHPVMMLACPGLRVALATTHLALRDVAAAITPDRLRRVLVILHDELRQRFGIAQPRILVCGLNPHAGEGGHLGREELEVIDPVLQQLRSKGLHLQGPLPADTLFNPDRLADADAVLAMYHDQGLPVLKYKGFGEAVNITLGLPVIRTSVDHGTALDLAGTGRADPGSLHAAIEQAITLIR